MSRSTRGVIVVVEAQLSRTGILWPAIAQQLGYRAIFLTNSPARYHDLGNFAEVFGDGSVKIVKADTDSVEGIESAVNHLHEHAELSALYTQCDYYLPQTAEAAMRLGLPGLNPQAALIARNKLRTREVCGDAGVPGPQFVHATSVEDAAAASHKLGLPCVVKPMTESASAQVALCTTEAEVVEHFQAITAHPFDNRGQLRVAGALIEEFCLGYEASVETISLNGEITVLGVTDRLLGPHPYFVAVGDVFPSCLPAEITEAIAATAVAALRAIGHDFGAAHTELRMTADGPRLIEINARIGGADVADLLQDALGIDVRQELLRIHAGESGNFAPVRRTGAATRRFTVPRGGVLNRIDGLEAARKAPGVVELLVAAEPGDTLEDAISEHALYGLVRAIAPTPAEAIRRADTAYNQISLVIND